MGKDGATVIAFSPKQDSRELTSRTDDELMLLCCADRRDAFERLARRYLAPLARFAGGYLGNTSVGDELAQEVLLQVWAVRRQYQPQGRFRTFLFTLARNRCRNAARDGARRGSPVELDSTDAVRVKDPRQVPLDQLLDEERGRRVREALTRLPEKLKESVLLRYDQGLEYSEIARILGRPEATVRSRVFLGMKQLRQGLSLGEEQ